MSLYSSSDEGEALKREAHRQLEAHRERLLRSARRVFLQHILNHGTASIDDVRAVVSVPPGMNPKVFGPVASPLATKNIVRSAGFVKTGRAIGHARPVTLWELIDRPAAEAWLMTNPEIDDQTEFTPFA